MAAQSSYHPVSMIQPEGRQPTLKLWSRLMINRWKLQLHPVCSKSHCLILSS